MVKLNSIERTVYNAIALDKELANDDVLLLEKVWQLYGWDENITLKQNLLRVPSAQSIIRSRRRLHQKGLIEYRKDTLERRYKMFQEKTVEYSENRSILDWLRRKK